jgi:hypothetical protein
MLSGNRVSIILAGTVFSVLVFANCIKPIEDKNCVSFEKAGVVKVDGPNTGLVNQDLALNVSFGCLSGCGQFGYFEQSENGDTTLLRVNAKYEGCICTMDAPIRITEYKFRKTRPGTYYLKFWANNGYLVDTVTIN